jgi:hypothetical protein
LTETTGTETTSTTTTATAGGDGGSGTEDVSGLKSALEKERDARKAADKTLKELQDKLAALEDKDKSDLDRTTAERDRLKADLDAREARLRELAVTTALTTAATKAGARYPDLIIGRVAKDAELDDDLTVKNADALIAAAKRDYPDLFRVVDGKADGGKRDESDKDDKVFGVTRLSRAHAQAARSR